MIKIIRNALIGWGVITGMIILQFIWLYSRYGLNGFAAFIQPAAYTNIPIALTSAAMIWTLAGFLLWLIFTGRITKTSALSWAGFFMAAFLYINVLRERMLYADVKAYVAAAFALIDGKILPDTYFYPPLWATLLSFLTPWGADGILLIIWIANILSFLLFYFLLQRTLEYYQFKPHAAALITTLFLLVNTPVLRTFMYGQVNFHMMNFILLSLLLYRVRPSLSALMLALAVHFKVSPAVLVLAFLLEFNWKWLLWFALSLILVGAFPIVFHGGSPYVDFINNFLLINAPHELSLHDGSFDSAIGMALSYLRADFASVRALVLLAKTVTAAVVIFLSIRAWRFFSNGSSKERIFESIVPLFVGMTLLSPLVWEHHAMFLTLPFLLLLKKLESPVEWMLYGTVYLLVFLMPIFDYFPWSYGRLVGMLILLGLLWKLRDRNDNSFFPAFNDWAEAVFSWKIQTKTT